MKVPLWRVAFARSGDKGDTANVGLIAFTESLYDAQGKTFSAALLRMHVDVPEQLVREADEVSGWSERPE
ncbi:MAG: hypothetical protein P8Y11_05780 [Gemmatimonadales bacterium]